MNLYDYASVPTEDDADGATSAKRVQDLQAEGYEMTGESGGAWHLRRERTPEEVLEAVVGPRASGALQNAGVPDLEAAQALTDAELDGVPGVGEKTVERVRRTRGAD